MKPHYTPELLRRLATETKNIEDHAKLVHLYQDLDAQGDIELTPELKNHISRPRHYFRFIAPLNTMDNLLDFYIKIIELQEKGFAIITEALDRRLKYQHELLKQNNH